jgi:hypothetical protein
VPGLQSLLTGRLQNFFAFTRIKMIMAGTYVLTAAVRAILRATSDLDIELNLMSLLQMRDRKKAISRHNGALRRPTCIKRCVMLQMSCAYGTSLLAAALLMSERVYYTYQQTINLRPICLHQS